MTSKSLKKCYKSSTKSSLVATKLSKLIYQTKRKIQSKKNSLMYHLQVKEWKGKKLNLNLGRWVVSIKSAIIKNLNKNVPWNNIKSIWSTRQMMFLNKGHFRILTIFTMALKIVLCLWVWTKVIRGISQYKMNVQNIDNKTNREWSQTVSNRQRKIIVHCRNPRKIMRFARFSQNTEQKSLPFLNLA